MIKHRHFILHKPYGYLSQFIYEGKRKSRKKLLGGLYDFPKGVMAIGRLDENSEGLLLLTTDGKVSEYIRSRKVAKEYYVQVGGCIDNAAIEKLQSGVEIGVGGQKYTTKPCKAFHITTLANIPIADRKIRDERHGPMSWVSITLTEGKFRQVRKMTAAVGFPTLRLIRVRIGNCQLQLAAGEVIEVDKFDT
ncbi:MAG TPA: pseudouridine synthase [Flavobacteriia bacterium]|nr:pseudouridine synthase [Flavobacteriia bacterium]